MIEMVQINRGIIVIQTKGKFWRVGDDVYWNGKTSRYNKRKNKFNCYIGILLSVPDQDNYARLIIEV